METISKVIKKTNTQVLCRLGVTKTPRGVQVFVQSSVFEDHFKTFGLMENNAEWGEAIPYGFPRNLPNNFNIMFNNWRGQLFVDGTSQVIPNLAMLRAEGISEGKTFQIEGMVYSKDELSRFVKNFREFALKYFEDYLKPTNVNVELSFTINESN